MTGLDFQAARIGVASAWVRRFAPLVERPGPVLDLACGGGRHLRHFLSLGYRVTGVDQQLDKVSDLKGHDGVELIAADLETDGPWSLEGRSFTGVIVANYLHRPRLPDLLQTVAPGGTLIYETYASGHERHGQPSNPSYLLKPGELLEAAAGWGTVVAYENGEVSFPRAAIIERIVAIRHHADGRPADPAPLPPPPLD